MTIGERLVRPDGKGSGASRVVRTRRPRGPEGVTIMDVRGMNSSGLALCVPPSISQASPCGSLVELQTSTCASLTDFLKPRLVPPWLNIQTLTCASLTDFLRPRLVPP